MTLPETLTVRAEVMARQVGDEIVILNLANGNYYGLDPVGARVWQLINEGKKLPEVCEVVLSEYAVLPEELERDLARLIQDLLAQGLVSIP